MGNTVVGENWQSDSEVVGCSCCSAAFSVTHRIHHCRACGSAVCAACSNKVAKVQGYENKERVCDKCAANMSEATELKPYGITVFASKWTTTWTLSLTDEELDQLPETLKTATLKMRELLGGRTPVVYPMPVGAYSVTKSKDWKPRPSDVIIVTFHKTGVCVCVLHTPHPSF
jgi:hypothetical protein